MYKEKGMTTSAKRKPRVRREKPRLFIAFCSERRAVADAFKKYLAADFDVLLSVDNGYVGGSLADKIISEIQESSFCIAILSCDDKSVRNGDNGDSTEFVWKPRDNVVFELGIFFGYFSADRVSVVLVEDQERGLPTPPVDLNGWYSTIIPGCSQNGVGASEYSKRIKASCRKIREVFFRSDRESIIPTLHPRCEGSRVFNNFSIDDVSRIWGKFTGSFLCVNPSWNLEIGDDSWLEIHHERYSSNHFHLAEYIIDIDGGPEPFRGDTRQASGNRKRDGSRDLLGMRNFINKMWSVYPDIEDAMNEKMKIYLKLGVRQEPTTFIAEYRNEERAFIFNRQIKGGSILEARRKYIVNELKAHTGHLKDGIAPIRPSEVALLCAQLGLQERPRKID